MKRFAVALLMASLFAAPALAVQVGQLPTDDGNVPTDQPRGHNDDRTPESYGEDNPTAPVPEPGTLALAAMSALALGAAARRRRNNKK
jgi:MYXO-CTERM domain-containing protein